MQRRRSLNSHQGMSTIIFQRVFLTERKPAHSKSQCKPRKILPKVSKCWWAYSYLKSMEYAWKTTSLLRAGFFLKSSLLSSHCLVVPKWHIIVPHIILLYIIVLHIILLHIVPPIEYHVEKSKNSWTYFHESCGVVCLLDFRHHILVFSDQDSNTYTGFVLHFVRLVLPIVRVILVHKKNTSVFWEDPPLSAKLIQLLDVISGRTG